MRLTVLGVAVLAAASALCEGYITSVRLPDGTTKTFQDEGARQDIQGILSQKYLTPVSVKAGDNISVETNALGEVTISASTGTEQDFTTNNTVLVETIATVAPSPGNYLAVSNAAMNARDKSDIVVYDSEWDMWTLDITKVEAFSSDDGYEILTGERLSAVVSDILQNFSQPTEQVVDDGDEVVVWLPDGQEATLSPGEKFWVLPLINSTLFSGANYGTGLESACGPEGDRLYTAYDISLSDVDVIPPEFSGIEMLTAYCIATRRISPVPTADRLATTSGVSRAISDLMPQIVSISEAEAGFTEWKLAGVPSGATNIRGPTPIFDGNNNMYSILFTYNGVDYEGWTEVSGEDVTLVVFDCTDVEETYTNITVTATRVRLPTMADLDGKVSTNDIALTTVYSQTPMFSEWTFSGDSAGTMRHWEVRWSLDDGCWILDSVSDSDPDDSVDSGPANGDLSDTILHFTEGPVVVTATRTRTDIIGYTLGSQTNNVLLSTNSISATNPNFSNAVLQVGILQTASNYTDSAIANADTSYRRFTVVTNVNQSVQYIELDDTQTSLVIDLPSTGDTKDWVVYVYAATNTTLSLPSGVKWWTSDAANTNALDAATHTALFFSQISDNIFILSRKTLKEILP